MSVEARIKSGYLFDLVGELKFFRNPDDLIHHFWLNNVFVFSVNF
jgi:hypothetical protein